VLERVGRGRSKRRERKGASFYRACHLCIMSVDRSDVGSMIVSRMMAVRDIVDRLRHFVVYHTAGVRG